jgi:hypothetical protein
MSRRLVAALLAGGLLGLVVAWLLQAVIARTAAPLSPERALWQQLLLAVAGGLSGFALSAVSALQAADPEAGYPRRRRRRRARPSSPRRPPQPPRG